MARVLIDGLWYEQIAPTSMYEADFERIVLAQAPVLYPEYHTVPFKKLVYSDSDARRADLALIDPQYRHWWVVEVEMSHHDLNRHVIPQVRTLANASYGWQEAKHLSDNNPLLDRDALSEMVKGRQPEVLVIVNAPKPDWIASLTPFGALIAVLEVFRSDRNHHVFRVNGQHPKALTGIVSMCAFDPILPRFLIVDSPATLGIPRNGRARIQYEGAATEWERVDSQDKVWLTPVSANPLPRGGKYELVRLSDGSLEIRVCDR